MKKRMALLLVAALLVVGGFGAYKMANQDPYAHLEVASGDASFEKYSTIDELEKNSELVVVARFTGKRELYERNDEQGNPIVKLTKSTVEVEKVLKGDAQKKGTITVFEDCYMWNNERYVTTEDYKWMNENGKYLLFLVPNKRNDTYVINALYQGKYDLKLKGKAKEHESKKQALLDPAVEYMGHDFELEEFYKMKEQAIKKYKL